MNQDKANEFLAFDFDHENYFPSMDDSALVAYYSFGSVVFPALVVVSFALKVVLWIFAEARNRARINRNNSSSSNVISHSSWKHKSLVFFVQIALFLAFMGSVLLAVYCKERLAVSAFTYHGPVMVSQVKAVFGEFHEQVCGSEMFCSRTYQSVWAEQTLEWGRDWACPNRNGGKSDVWCVTFVIDQICSQPKVCLWGYCTDEMLLEAQNEVQECLLKSTATFADTAANATSLSSNSQAQLIQPDFFNSTVVLSGFLPVYYGTCSSPCRAVLDLELDRIASYQTYGVPLAATGWSFVIAFLLSVLLIRRRRMAELEHTLDADYWHELVIMNESVFLPSTEEDETEGNLATTATTDSRKDFNSMQSALSAKIRRQPEAYKLIGLETRAEDGKDAASSSFNSTNTTTSLSALN